MNIRENIMLKKQKIVIGVMGIGRGAGATTIAMKLAGYMGKASLGVSFVEEDFGNTAEGKAGAYELLAVDRRFKGRKLWDFYGMAREGRNIENKVNFYEDVNWVLKLPQEEEEDITPLKPLDYTSLAGRYIVVDTPLHPLKTDLLIAVVDALPSKIGAAIEEFEEIKGISEGLYPPVLWMLNKNNPHVDRRWLEKFLEIEVDCIEYLHSPEEFYGAEYGCDNFLRRVDMRGTRALAEKIFTQYER